MSTESFKQTCIQNVGRKQKKTDQAANWEATDYRRGIKTKMLYLFGLS